MMGLDLRSIILMSGIIGLLLAMVLLFLRLSYPKSIKGLGWWAAAPAVCFLSALLFAARGQIPDLVSVVAANGLLLTGIAMFHFGARHFFGLAPAYWSRMALILAVLPVLAWYTLAEPSFTARVLIVSLLWAYIQMRLAVLIWRHGPEVFSTGFTVVVLLIHTGTLVLRFLSAWLPLPDEHLLDPTRVQTLYVVMNALFTVSLGVGLILMAGDRLRVLLEHSASHDFLTNALSRRTLITACEQELARCRRHGRSMALLMLDIDLFKLINDIHGHQMGDRILVDVVSRISPLLRRPDQLGRFGGEEFVVVLPETTLEQALIVAERIRAAVAQPAAELPPITASIGVTTNQPDDAEVDVLLARADQALYKAKAEGRNCIAVV
ncbi:MAG: GGDEF domain-containing protein [Burkholderiales bacterium]|nr:GGDEF domain-containing protein [Burkholderiales bacterium]